MAASLGACTVCFHFFSSLVDFYVCPASDVRTGQEMHMFSKEIVLDREVVFVFNFFYTGIVSRTYKFTCRDTC